MNRQHPRLASAVLGLAFAFSAVPAPADIVVLNDGKKVEGEVAEKDGTYDVKTRYGSLAIQKSDVRRVVRNVAQLADEADALRQSARGLYDEALKAGDAAERNRKLDAAVELLKKALRVYDEAGEIFAAPENDALDRATVAAVQEMKLVRDAMRSEVVTPAPAPPPSVSPLPAEPRTDAPAVESRKAPPTDAPATQADRWLADARKALDARRFADARYTALRVVQQYPGTPAAEEAQALLEALPHPDGRLVSGFDTPADLRAWRLANPYKKNVVFELVTDPKTVKEGKGAAHLVLPRDPDYTTGALVMELERFDEARFKGISFWLYQERPSPGRLEVAFIRPNQLSLPWIDRWGASDLGACLYRAIPLDFAGWKKVTIAMPEFQARGASGSNGKIGWRDAGALVVYDASRKGVDVVIDSLRCLESEKR
jgi:hypothetical protein